MVKFGSFLTYDL